MKQKAGIHTRNKGKRKICTIREIKVLTVWNTGYRAKALSPWDATNFFNKVVARSQWFDSEKECIVVLCLDPIGRVKSYSLAHMGSADRSLAAVREVFRPAVCAAASGIIVMHNHTCGDTTPSQEDIAAAKKLSSAGELLNIPLHDFIIVGHNSMDSLWLNGQLPIGCAKARCQHK